MLGTQPTGPREARPDDRLREMRDFPDVACAHPGYDSGGDVSPHSRGTKLPE